MTFKEFLKNKRNGIAKASPEQDFIEDTFRSGDLPSIKTWKELRTYLSFNHACPEAIEAGRAVFDAWKDAYGKI